MLAGENSERLFSIVFQVILEVILGLCSDAI